MGANCSEEDEQTIGPEPAAPNPREEDKSVGNNTDNKRSAGDDANNPILLPTPTYYDDDEVRNIYQGGTGQLPDRRWRMERVSRFPSVVVCGKKNYDEGVIVEGVAFDGSFHKDLFDVTKKVFHKYYRFEDMKDGEKKSKLCLDWVWKVILAFAFVLNESTAEVNRTMNALGDIYHRPMAETHPDGSITVRLFCKVFDENSDTVYEHREYKFNDDGSMKHNFQVLDRRDAPIANRDTVQPHHRVG